MLSRFFLSSLFSQFSLIHSLTLSLSLSLSLCSRNFLSIGFSVMFILAVIIGYLQETGNMDFNPNTVGAESGFRAIAVFLCWVGLIKYLQFYIEFYMLILSMKASAVRVGRFIITVAPVFMAFVFAGLILFSDKTDVNKEDVIIKGERDEGEDKGQMCVCEVGFLSHLPPPLPPSLTHCRCLEIYFVGVSLSSA